MPSGTSLSFKTSSCTVKSGASEKGFDSNILVLLTMKCRCFLSYCERRSFGCRVLSKNSLVLDGSSCDTSDGYTSTLSFSLNLVSLFDFLYTACVGSFPLTSFGYSWVSYILDTLTFGSSVSMGCSCISN
jgi:hypothetical protein